LRLISIVPIKNKDQKPDLRLNTPKHTNKQCKSDLL